MTDAEIRARKKYAAKGRRFTVDCYQTERDIIDWLEGKENVSGYIKALIRADMQK